MTKWIKPEMRRAEFSAALLIGACGCSCSGSVGAGAGSGG
jgi:hypothetical protein